jgi:hypothetical protein
MQVIGIIGLTLAGAEPFAQPPRGSAARSSRRQRPFMRPRVTRAIRWMTAADEEQGITPRLLNYPY